jgi:hypothetical protein
MHSLEQIKANLTSIDRQLSLMIYEELVEIKCLLQAITNDKERDIPVVPDDHTHAPESAIESLKRPELMKLIAKMKNKPIGFQKWGTKQMREHLKGAS